MFVSVESALMHVLLLQRCALTKLMNAAATFKGLHISIYPYRNISRVLGD